MTFQKGKTMETVKTALELQLILIVKWSFQVEYTLSSWKFNTILSI